MRVRLTLHRPFCAFAGKATQDWEHWGGKRCGGVDHTKFRVTQDNVSIITAKKQLLLNVPTVSPGDDASRALDKPCCAANTPAPIHTHTTVSTLASQTKLPHPAIDLYRLFYNFQSHRCCRKCIQEKRCSVNVPCGPPRFSSALLLSPSVLHKQTSRFNDKRVSGCLPLTSSVDQIFMKQMCDCGSFSDYLSMASSGSP